MWLPIAVLICFAVGPAFAQVTPPLVTPPPTQDEPPGYPYNTVVSASNNASVPLRDFLSSRIDSLRVELLSLIDERDVRYSQRFEAQNQSVSAALSSAQTAVAKAEAATADRFASVNEFRQTLSDQALNFANKDAVETRFKSLEDHVATIIARLNTFQDERSGASNLWGFLIGAVGIVLAISAFAITNLRRQSPK